MEELSGPKRTVLYRVTQAALTNVIQHAKASRVSVVIYQHARRIRLEVADNGRGFSVEMETRTWARRGKHLGLLGMKERVEMVGGSFSVESAPDRGTAVRVEIPSDQRDEKPRPSKR